MRKPKIWEEKTQQPSEHLVGLGLIFPQPKTSCGQNEEMRHGQRKHISKEKKILDQPKLRVYVTVSHQGYMAGECLLIPAQLIHLLQTPEV